MNSTKKLLKRIYKQIPFKRHLYALLKTIYKPSAQIYQHLYFEGIFKVNIRAHQHFKMMHYGYQIENEIFWNGIFEGWEKYSLRIWAEFCKSSGVIFDIGANTGVYSLIAKATNPVAVVYAMEPVERVFEKLTYNVALNNFDIQCIRKAASNYDGKATIYDKATAHTYSVTVNADISANPQDSIPTEIETVTLDTLIKQYEIQKIDLLKIDVETHEVEVLEGFRNHIQLFQPTMLIEILNDQIAKGIQKIIQDMDYIYFNIDENRGIRQVDSLSRSDYYNFLICKPEFKEKITKLFQ